MVYAFLKSIMLHDWRWLGSLFICNGSSYVCTVYTTEQRLWEEVLASLWSLPMTSVFPQTTAASIGVDTTAVVASHLS